MILPANALTRTVVELPFRRVAERGDVPAGRGATAEFLLDTKPYRARRAAIVRRIAVRRALSRLRSGNAAHTSVIDAQFGDEKVTLR